MTKGTWVHALAGLCCLAGSLIPAGMALSQEAPQPAAAPGAAAAPPETPSETPADAGGDPQLATAMDAGQAGYLANCRPCHGSRGTAGVPLVGNEKVSAGPDYLGWAILTGPGYMPEFDKALDDQQIADISTFILNSWGNSYGLVLAEDIQALR